MFTKKEKLKSHKFFKSIVKWRDLPIYELISYPIMFASVPMLAYGNQPYNLEIIRLIVLTVLTMFSGFFAALIWNDINDYDIDIIAHPNRLLPSGIIKSTKLFYIALIFSAFTFIFAFLISVWCLFLVGIAALFVAVHNKYLKRRIRIPAYSEIFGPLQWTVVAVFGFFVIWTALPQNSEIYLNIAFIGHISASSNAFLTMLLLLFFTYFADNSHDIAEGLHDSEADNKYGVNTFATSFGMIRSTKIVFFMFGISGIIGVILFIQSILSPIFLILFLMLFIYTFYYPLNLLKCKKEELKKQDIITGRKLYNYFLFSFNLIFFDLIIQIYFY